jgi:hypothetical protein
VNPSMRVSVRFDFSTATARGRHSGRRRASSSVIEVNSKCCTKANKSRSGAGSRISMDSNRGGTTTDAGRKVTGASAISHCSPAHGSSAQGIRFSSPVAVDICQRRHRVWNDRACGVRTVFAGSRTGANACRQLSALQICQHEHGLNRELPCGMPLSTWLACLD